MRICIVSAPCDAERRLLHRIARLSSQDMDAAVKSAYDSAEIVNPHETEASAIVSLLTSEIGKALDSLGDEVPQ